MKRNHPPNNSGEDHGEQKIIDDRLNQLFSPNQIRKVLHSNNGVWCNSYRHVRLNPNMNPHQFDGLVISSSELGYNYLNPYEALYLLESKRLIIYLNEFPLSLSEAYQLLLKDANDFKNYAVFLQLNSCGYFCMKPVDHRGTNMKSNDNLEPEKSAELYSKNPQSDISVFGPLFNICSITRPFREVLTDIRKLGPQEYKDINMKHQVNSLNISFDVYKRETFTKNKPRKGLRGNPDYLVIVCDKLTSMAPSSTQLLAFNQTHGEDLSKKLLFALVDADSTICFAQFKIINSIDLESAYNRWFE